MSGHDSRMRGKRQGDPRELERVIDLCIEARERLDRHGATRLRILIDVLLLELGRELARSTDGNGL